MSKIEDILKHKNLEGTVVNKYGEGIELGKPTTVKHNRYSYTFCWDVKPSEHKSPLDTLLLHDGGRILKVIPVSLFRMDGKVKSLTVHV